MRSIRVSLVVRSGISMITRARIASKFSAAAALAMTFANSMIFANTAGAAIHRADSNSEARSVRMQSVSEVKSRRQKSLRFDSDIKRLASLERRYLERLPGLQAPAERIQKKKYRRGAGASNRQTKKSKKAYSQR